MYRPRTWAWAIACSLIGLSASIAPAQEPRPARSLAADSTLRQARQLLEQNEVSNAIILLESQLDSCSKDPQYLTTITEAYRRQFDRLQREGKVPQASQVWTKLVALQPALAKAPGPRQLIFAAYSAIRTALAASASCCTEKGFARNWTLSRSIDLRNCSSA